MFFLIDVSVELTNTRVEANPDSNQTSKPTSADASPGNIYLPCIKMSLNINICQTLMHM